MSDQPDINHATPQQPPTAPEPAPEPPAEPDDTLRIQKLERTVGGLLASVDQQHSEISSVLAVCWATAFAFGVLAGIVFLHSRQLKELQGALPG